MDNFLPNDIAIMVLKYLASKGCSSSVSAMIEDMPALKFFVPSKPPDMTQPEYLRLLARPSFTPALEDVLNDYGRAKSMIAEVAESHEPSKSPIRPTDSMVTQLKQLSSRLEEKRNSQQQVFQSASSALVIRTSPDDKIERISTLFPVGDNVAGSSTRIRNDEDRMQYPEPKELPLVIYNSLMNDSNLHEKIASAINEEVLDSKNSKSEGTPLLKVRSKMESEVNLDKFLNELLRDGTNDFIDIIPSSLLSPGRSRHSNQSSMDGALSNLFQDANSLISNDTQKGQGLGLQTINTDQIRSMSRISTADVEAKSSNSAHPVDISNSSLSSSDSSSQSRSTTSSLKPAISKKRIVPQPAAPCVKSNPVFETVQEFVTTTEGNKYTVKEIVPVIPKWQQLGRRSIAPKIPTVKPTTTPPKSITQTEGTSSSSVIGSASKRKKLATPLKRSPDKASNTEHNFCLVYHDPFKVITSSTTTASVDTQSVKLEHTAKDEGGNSTPSNMQQETTVASIASNSINELDKEVESDSNSKEERLSLVSPNVSRKSETPKYVESSNSFKASLSQMIEVTPILDSSDGNGVIAPLPVSVQEPTANISPRIRRLIASAQKARAPTTQINLVKKSFSTPRKKKHVRNLHFTTPPSAKNSVPAHPAHSLPNNGFDVKPLTHKRKLGSDETDRCEEPPSKKLAMKSPEEENDPAVYKSSAFPDRKFTCKYIAESVIQSAKKVLITKGTDLTAASKADTVRVETQNVQVSTATVNNDNQKSSRKFAALSKITEEELPESLVEKRDKIKNNIPRSENLSGIVTTTSPQSVVTVEKEARTPDVASASAGTSVQSELAVKSNEQENKPCTAKSSETPTPVISLKPDINLGKNSLSLDVSEDLEEGECLDSNPDFPSPASPESKNTRRKSYNEQMLDLFGPMTPDVKGPSRRNSSINDKTSVADNKSKPLDSAKEVASRTRKPSGNFRKSRGSPEPNRFKDSCSRDSRRTSNISSSKQKLLSTPERKEDHIKPSRASDRVREKREREQEEKGRRQKKEQELRRGKGEKKYRDGCKDDRESELKNKRRTPKKNQIRDSIGEKEEKKVDQVLKQPKSIDSSLTPPSDQRKTPRRTKQGIDVAAAKSVAVDAVAVCRNSSVSPKSPIKRNVKIQRESFPPCTSDKQGQVKESVKTVSTTSTAPVNPVIQKVEATPMKDNFVPFSILPGPVGFPDPTPVKTNFHDYYQGTFSFQNRSLVTPIKTSQISPPASVPVTPKIVMHEDTESNSLSAFRSTEGMLWTPSKFFEPPPTPGRTIFVDEHSQAASTAETNVMTLHAAASDQSTIQSTETPLDLSSPVAPHRMQEILGCEQSSSSSSSESQSGSSTDSTSTTSSSDDAKKADDVHFQIPVGAPKKASPILPSLNKRSAVPKHSPSVQNSQRNSASPVKKISSKESKAAINQAQPVQKQQTKAESIRKSPLKSTGLPVCSTTYRVKGEYKHISASEHQPLVELAGSVGTNSNTPEAVEKAKKKSGESDGSPLLQGGFKIRSLLKKVDVNRFLTQVVHNRDS